MVPFKSLGTVSYSYSTATMAVSSAVSTQHTNVTDRHPSRQTPHDGIGCAANTDVAVEVAKSMSQVVLTRKQHADGVAGEITERRSDVAQVTRYVRHLGLQLGERCQPTTYQPTLSEYTAVVHGRRPFAVLMCPLKG